MNIDIKNLCFRYKNSKDNNVDHVNMNIEDGEIISILGESGSGKSTMLRLISGLEIPHHGSIKIGDKFVVDNNTFIMPEKREVGMVFQDYALFPHMTVEKNIMFGLNKMESKKKKLQLDHVLTLVGLSEYRKRYPHELSGGQQQRVALARALAPMPSLLLFDEPFSNLDAQLKSDIRNQLKGIIKQTGLTSIFVTHDKEDAIAIADRVILLSKGKVIKSGDPREVLINI